ncbi:putative mitochondrial protein [Sesamum angolense]|uniref:Mitochondrial protein n=1 Tax=Sesamum angolense TaxID=2727404 RepID=A0AAE1T2T8_9LAMI|nr:putative mitochondrial protein [Sesamum angolense]
MPASGTFGSQPARPSGGGEGAPTVVYGANDTISRRGLWQKLVLLANSISDEPWIVGGERFSWHNCSEGDRNLWKRLDRLLVNDAWLSQWPNSHYHCLNARTSDHSPLVIRGDTATLTVSMIRFDNYLTMSSDFTSSVQNIWRHRIEGTAIATKLEQNMLQQRAKIKWLKGGDQCSRIFFRKRLLGGERRREFLDLTYLRPSARHVVTPDECMELVQLVTLEEIKDAFFDIAEDKAPGPDGYSSSFYKAAWPVIGEEVVKAILEFFSTGRLLKQVNTTILALIPKVRVPSLVSDFRPISCCNVLYKVITKIIVQRLRSVLDKMINPSQNAFVPGRSIGDNILLAQEMFSGYNRQGLPMRCALKVDLRKAYETVEWDFLSVVLHLFGFPDIFIGWIEECVTTPMFLVCINGNPHGFFKGSRGLRQGDPMSPFLFVLIMEVLQLMLQQRIDQNEGFSFHWRCKEIGLFQLCFANDLLLFCKADVASVRIFRHGLDEFAKLSGLHANPQKSQLILSRSAPPMREHLLAALQFQEGHLPLRYLGLPLLASRLLISDCQPLLLKIDSRIKGWDSIQLSFAGRLQLIKSVLMSLNVYWAMAFILPKGVIRAVEKRMRHFLWKGNSAVGYPKAQSVWTVDAKGGSWGWRKLLRLRSALLPYIEFKIGNGELFSIWHDPWHSLGTLIRRFPSGPSRTNIPITAKLSAVIVEEIRVGLLSPIWSALKSYICYRLSTTAVTLFFGAGVNSLRRWPMVFFRTPGPIVGWYPLLSGPCKIPRFSFVLWLAILGKLSTMDNHGYLILEGEAPSSGSVKPQSPRAVHQLLAAATFEASTAASHWGPLVASACDALTAAPVAFGKSTAGQAALGPINATGQAALGPNNAAPSSCFAELQLLTSFGKATAGQAALVPSMRLDKPPSVPTMRLDKPPSVPTMRRRLSCFAELQLLTSPPTLLSTTMPLTENSMDAEDDDLCRNHDSLTNPPPRSSPLPADAWEVEVVDNPSPPRSPNPF